MMDLKDRRIQIVIWCNEPFNITRGGIVVLYYLCNLINELNHLNFYSKIYIPYKVEKPNYFKNIYYCDDIAEINNDTLVIYPEDIETNPLFCKHVVRWRLSDNLVASFGWKNTDLIYTWEKYYDNNKNDTEKKLSVPYLNPIFKNKNKKERIKTCFLIKKGGYLHKNISFFHPADSIFINNYEDIEKVVDIFNECKYFYCYDPNCMYTIYAVLCGCITILYPTKDKTKDEYFKISFYNKNNKIYNYGIAYGNSEEEIKFATDTLADGELMYKEFFESYKDTVYDFLKDLEIYFKEN
jgi:hypothetical protein